MTDNYIDKVQQAGVVGAGGAGFPTHVKLKCNADVVIANGAECEPLLRVDQQLMEVYAKEVVAGLEIAMKVTNAPKGVICLKKKYKKAIVKLTEVIKDKKNIELKIINDFYPAGDEQQLVYEVTKKVVPVGGLPIDVGAVVNNVSTLISIYESINNKPVITRVITITGKVKQPKTLVVPLGTPFKELIEYCDGPSDQSKYSIIVGGPMMGNVENDWNGVVTKTTSGLIILPNDHYLITKKTRKPDTEMKLAKAVCCQCSYCTDMCPRNILGLGTEPHKVMRGLANEDPSVLANVASVITCCDCRLCTYYACPMGLEPGGMTTMVKGAVLSKGPKLDKTVPHEVDSLRDSKKVPTKRLISRLELDDYNLDAPLDLHEFKTSSVKILLKQHIGVTCTSFVKKGDKVNKYDLIATPGDKLGANIHASISGIVKEITNTHIIIAGGDGN